jgi:hypothetical protein
MCVMPRGSAGAPGTFRGHLALVVFAPSTVTSTASTTVNAARQRGALCTFPGHPALVLFAPSTVMGTVTTTACFFSGSGLANPSRASYGVEP